MEGNEGDREAFGTVYFRSGTLTDEYQISSPDVWVQRYNHELDSTIRHDGVYSDKIAWPRYGYETSISHE